MFFPLNSSFSPVIENIRHSQEDSLLICSCIKTSFVRHCLIDNFFLGKKFLRGNYLIFFKESYIFPTISTKISDNCCLSLSLFYIYEKKKQQKPHICSCSLFLMTPLESCSLRSEAYISLVTGNSSRK